MLQSTAITDVGRRRGNNEDAFVELPEWGVYCVADGMGGGESGEEASAAIMEFLTQAFAKTPPETSLEERVAIFHRTMDRTSAWLMNRFELRGSRGGSTVVGLILDMPRARRAVIVHAGDSRAYVYRRASLRRITLDHSVMERNGKGEFPTSALLARGAITRAVGLHSDVEMDQTVMGVEHGDVFLLCSDGLTAMLPDDAIAGILARHHANGLKAAARALVDSANRAGGLDNITVLLLSAGTGFAHRRRPGPAAGETALPPPAPSKPSRVSPLLLPVLLLALALLIWIIVEAMR